MARCWRVVSSSLLFFFDTAREFAGGSARGDPGVDLGAPFFKLGEELGGVLVVGANLRPRERMVS